MWQIFCNHENISMQFCSWLKWLKWCMAPWLKEGWLRQVGWIFGKVPKGGGASFSIQKIMLQILGTLNRAFWVWNWYKRVISGFSVCFFFNNCIEKNQNKTHFEFPPLELYHKIVRFWGAPLRNRSLPCFGNDWIKCKVIPPLGGTYLILFLLS